MLCPGCHLEIMVPAGALTRWELTASESVHSMGMTWEVCDKTQPGNWSKTIQDHKTPFFQMLCASKWHNITFLIMHATPWSMCELTLKPWKQQFECTFCLWGFLLGFCYCCFGWAETDFVLYQAQIAEVSSSSIFFSWLYFFHPKDAVVCDLKNGAGAGWVHKALLELELLEAARTQAWVVVWGIAPFDSLIYFNKPPYFSLI